MIQVFKDAMVASKITSEATDDHPDSTSIWTNVAEGVAYAMIRIPKDIRDGLDFKRPKHIKVVPISMAHCDDGYYRLVMSFRNKKKKKDDDKKEE